MYFIINILNHFIFLVNSFLLKIKWRIQNRHNATTISKSVSNLSIIKVGKHSYGKINIQTFGNTDEKLTIGNYVSIANNVVFIMGGNHQINTFTTFPLKSIFIKNTPFIDATTKGEIIIKDEVWIGYGVIILSGITIGEGAIIAAGSIVTKNVAPYTIVGGNPAKFIKKRFSEDLIEKRQKININKFSKDDFTQNIDLFYEQMSSQNLDKIIKQKKNTTTKLKF